ncbi:ABC transporter ATP-binding protein [Bordetella genomosp. 4]|uniref:Branched-chain amino acid ABC transporter ATP-binding protein n=1 Tax=Bordetella genomosp. 4 TaxID=463044 RepID=A0A261TTX8_9BORD|nr:ABC transporter ATP-binding protein [Bordetella genomosp. 4]OZI52885.1 branched-chain amino acid ABC transporter ATP-binding protein [Bordetella genomosp. 4]
MAPLLETRSLNAGYGEMQVLHEVAITFAQNRITVIVGSNGAGKTSLMRTLAGLLPVAKGLVLFDGQDISHIPTHQRLAGGLAMVPEGRLVFPDFTVEDTLRVGAYTCRARRGWQQRVRSMFEMFPRLQQRRAVRAGSLSGGEQQMLALARALMSEPKMLLLDEPSLGLSPAMAQEVFEAMRHICAQGVTIGLVEQNAYAALSLADYAYVLENGAVTMSGPSTELLESPEVRRSYLGM